MSAQPDNLFGSAANDPDAQETREWVDALSAVIESEGRERCQHRETVLAHGRLASPPAPPPKRR